MKKTKKRALYIVAALLAALFVLSCLVGFAACGGGSKDCAHENVTWDETKTVDATCGKDGSKTGTCDDCDETVTETIPATGNHTWDDGVVTLEPTATEKGVMTYTCEVCGATKTEDIAAGTTPNPEEPEASFSVTLSESLSVVEGLTSDLTVTITADDASEAKISWTSSEPTVASVTADASDSTKATVAGNAAGSATITVTVTIDEEEVSATCAVTVTAAVATDIELDATSMSVAVGDVNALKATITMNNSGTYAGSYTWKSSDESVATVSGSGSEATVTALKAGAASISVSVDGVEAASCAVTVSERLAVPDATSDADALKLNETESFEGYDYTVESTTITSVDEETEVETEEDVYLITGTASAMTDSIVKWYNGGDTGAAKKGDSYITLKIFVGLGNTISYTSAGDEEKSYTNTTEKDGSMFDGDYLFVCERLTGVNSDGSQVTTLDGVSYTITDASGNVREEVSIIFDMTTVAWDGTSHSEAWYTTTKSSEKDEFTIYSAEELAGLAHIVNEATDNNNDKSERSFNSQKVKLGANIDLGSKNWTPIGHQKDDNITGATVTEYFAGDFDGNGYTIYNLDIEPGEGEEHEQIGLFGHVFGGTFENIHIHNAKVVGTKNVGALAGATQAGNGSGGTYGQSCTFSNCTVDGLVDVEGNYQVGGLIGDLTQTTLVNCSVIGDEGSKVTAWDGDTSNNSEYSAGGMIGCAVGDSKSTSSIVTTGDWKWSGLSVSGLEISSPARVGGIAGKYYDECGKLTMEDCTVSDCVLSIIPNAGSSKTPTIGAFIGVYVAEICVLDGNKVDNVQINYTDENYIGSSSDGTYLLFGGSEPQTAKESSTYVSFNSDGATYKIATSGLTATHVRVSVPVADFTFNNETFNGTTAEITATDDGFKIDNIVANKMTDDQKTAFDESYTSDETTRFYIAVQIAVQPGETVTVSGGGKTEGITNETDKVSYTLWVIEIGQSHFTDITAANADEDGYVAIDLSSFSISVSVTASDNSTTSYTISFGNVLVAATDLAATAE